MRLSRTLWLLGLAGLLAACGGEEAPTGQQQPSPAEPPPATAPAEPVGDEAAVSNVVVTYFNALADRDFSTACLQLGPDAQRAVGRLTQIRGDCEDALEVAFEGFTDQDLSDLRDPPITAVDVTGDTAAVTIEGATGPVPLARIDGAWLISEFAAA